VAEKLDPLHARLELTDAELKKIVLRLPAVLGYKQPRQPCGGETRPAASTPGAGWCRAEEDRTQASCTVLGYNHDSLVAEQLDLLQARLELTS
jgi:hypothetical protein